jgi:hypothetical protein
MEPEMSTVGTLKVISVGERMEEPGAAGRVI